jgi:HSP20 family protein
MTNRNMLTLMDEFFDQSLRPFSHSLGRSISGATPLLNVKEYSDKYEITMTIPGINAEEIEIKLDNGVLSISYDHKDEVKEENDDGELLRQEYAHYSFSRSVSLPKNVDADSIEASSQDGILTISVGKHPQSQPRRISVNVNK